MALEIPHSRVADDKQTQNLDRLKPWADGVDEDIAALEAADAALDSRVDALEDYDSYHVIGQPGQPAFENSWVNYDITSYQAASFWKDRNMVHIAGLVKSGSSFTVFTLPSGYRPPFAEFFPAATDTGYGSVVVGADGHVSLISGGTGWASLSPISFRI